MTLPVAVLRLGFRREPSPARGGLGTKDGLMIPDALRAKRQAMQAQAFDRIGARYEEAFPRKEGQLAATEWLIERLPAGARVLDVGCGTGLPSGRRLVDAGLQVTGIDISEEMLQLARCNVPGAELLRLDVVD